MPFICRTKNDYDATIKRGRDELKHQLPNLRPQTLAALEEDIKVWVNAQSWRIVDFYDNPEKMICKALEALL